MPESIDRSPTNDSLALASPAFLEKEEIPPVYTCEGDNISPPLTISGVTEEGRSMVLIMDDPDAPTGVFDHWVVFDIPTGTTEIPEGQEPSGTLGVGTSGQLGYFGPCPPGERHRYVFTLYVLDRALDLPEGSTKEEVLEEMTGSVIQKAQLTAYFER